MGPAVARVLEQEDGVPPASGLGEGIWPMVDELAIAVGEKNQRSPLGGCVGRGQEPRLDASGGSRNPDLLGVFGSGWSADGGWRRKEEAALDEEEERPVYGKGQEEGTE